MGTIHEMAERADPADRTAAWAAVLRVHATVLPKLEREVQAMGLPLAWYDVLLVLNSAPGRRLRMSELGHGVVLSRERVSRVVSEMATAGLVDRRPNPDDRRSWYAQITPDGRARLRRAAPAYLRGIERHVNAHLDDDEIAAVAAALSKVLAAEE